MATFKDLGIEYAKYIKLNRNNPSVVNEIIKKIDSLVFTDTSKPLSKEDKLQIIKYIQDELLKKKYEDGHLIIEAEDSTELVNLIQMLQDNAQK